METLYSGFKVYGPYTRKDMRKHVVLVHPDGRRRTVSYPKYLVELHLGKMLQSDETVDHIDRDPNNNALSNLQALKRSEHGKLDAKRADYSERSFTCPGCGKVFTLSGEKLRWAASNRKRDSSGPYCSRRCAGIDSHNKLRVTSVITIQHYHVRKSLGGETCQVDPANSENPLINGNPELGSESPILRDNEPSVETLHRGPKLYNEQGQEKVQTPNTQVVAKAIVVGKSASERNPGSSPGGATKFCVTVCAAGG